MSYEIQQTACIFLTKSFLSGLCIIRVSSTCYAFFPLLTTLWPFVREFIPVIQYSFKNDCDLSAADCRNKFYS